MPNDNLTTKDYFDLSDGAYINMSFSSEQENGWTVINQTQNPNTGYEAVAFKAPNGEIIIAHRGSDSLSSSIDKETIGNPIKDWTESDLAIANGEVPPQFHDADAFSKEIMQEHGDQITHTGHSLGGALAQLTAHKNGGNAVTFDPPGTSEVIQNSDLFENEINHNQFQTLVVQNSAVSSINTQIGNLTKIDLFDGNTNVHLKGHYMENIQNAFADNGEIDSSFLSNMSTETESAFHEFAESAMPVLNVLEPAIDPLFDAKEFIEDSAENLMDGIRNIKNEIFDTDDSAESVLEQQEELKPNGHQVADNDIVLPDDFQSSGVDASDSAVLGIASELESNINLMYTNLERLASSINGI